MSATAPKELRKGGSEGELARRSARQPVMVNLTAMSLTVPPGDEPVDAAELADLCQRFGVTGLALFGSAGRGQLRPPTRKRSRWLSLPGPDLRSQGGKVGKQWASARLRLRQGRKDAQLRQLHGHAMARLD